MYLDIFDYFSCLQLLILMFKLSHLWPMGASTRFYCLVIVDTTTWVFGSFLAAWYDKLFLDHLIYLLPQTWRSPFLQGALVLISGRLYLEPTAWVPGTLHFYTLSILLCTSSLLFPSAAPYSIVCILCMAQTHFFTAEWLLTSCYHEKNPAVSVFEHVPSFTCVRIFFFKANVMIPINWGGHQATRSEKEAGERGRVPKGEMRPRAEWDSLETIFPCVTLEWRLLILPWSWYHGLWRKDRAWGGWAFSWLLMAALPPPFMREKLSVL